jgi:hypothetical protein
MPRRSLTLSSATGTSVALDGLRDGYVLLPGVTGLGMPPVSLAADPLPSSDGSVFRGLRYAERDLFIPVAILGDDATAVTSYRRVLERLLSPRGGPVTLTVTHPSGEQRRITGWYIDGAKGDEGSDQAGRCFEKKGLLLRCLGPWWYAEQQTQSWVLTETAVAFLDPTKSFFPITLMAAEVEGAATVVNDGDGDAEPIWDVTGPGDSVTVSSRGQSWVYGARIEPEQTIRVDCRRTHQTVVDVADGRNLFAHMSGDPALWLLTPGPNDISVAMPGADIRSRIQIRWSPRFETSG